MDVGTGAALAGGLNVVGDVIQNDANRRASHENMDFQQMMWDKNYTLQKEFAQNGIRWRVADAGAAGLHPLAAIGMQGQAGSPISVGDVQFQPSNMSSALHSMSQNVSSAIRAQRTPEEKMKSDLEIQLLTNQVGESDARRIMYLSEAAKNAQTDNGRPGFGNPYPVGGGSLPALPGLKKFDGYVTPTAPQQYSRDLKDSSRVASNNPMWEPREIAPGVFADFPYTGGGESPLESMDSMGAWGLFLWKNLLYNNIEKAKQWKSRQDWSPYWDNWQREVKKQNERR